MDKITDFFKHLDLTDGEAKTYLTLLKSDALSVRELASKTGIKRTTAYLYIDQLIEKGLIIKLVEGSRKLVAATEPKENLSILAEKKLHTAKTIKEELPDMLKTINESLPQIKSTENSEIKYSKGINAVRKIYEEAFIGNEIRSYVKVEENPLLSSNNVTLFSNALKMNKKLKIWEIICKSPTSRKLAVNNMAKNYNYFYKFMPPDLKWSITSEDIIIYDGKVAIINYKEKVSSIVLQSPNYYHNSKEIFDFIWRTLPEPSPKES